MADVEYRYPNSTSPTASWLPGVCPSFDGSDQEDDDGVATSVAAGGKQWSDQIADPTYFVTHAFLVPYSKVTEWRTFRDAVLGRQFQVKDPELGGFIDVMLWAYSRRWTPVSGTAPGMKWRGTIVLRKVVA